MRRPTIDHARWLGASSSGVVSLNGGDRTEAALRQEIKHQWLFLPPLDSVLTVRRLVAFYVDAHDGVLPHSAFRGQTTDEMYFGTGDAIAVNSQRADLTPEARLQANRSATCETCPALTTMM